MKSQLKMLAYVLLGNTMLVFSICAFILPNNFMLGGASGIALTIQNFLPLRLSIISGVVNSVLFIIGWIFLGWKFAATSLVSTIVYPIIMAIFEELPMGELFAGDKVMCALFGGIMMGAGIGLVVRAGGSTGGMDIPPCILQKYKGIPVGTSLLFFDTLIVVLQIVFKGMDGILYSLCVIALTSMTVNKTIVMGENKIEIMIISPKYKEIKKELLKTMDSGVTLFNIETGYEGVEQKAIYSIVYAKKYPEIKKAALAIDKKAFVVAANVMDVNGRGYTLAKHGEIQD